MTDEEWRQTETAQSITAFMAVMLSVLMNLIGGEIGGAFTRLASADVKTDIEKQIESAGLPPFLKELVDPDRDEAMRGGMYLISILSALEACIEELVKAAIRANPAITDSKPYEKLKISGAGYFGSMDDRIEKLYRAIEEAVGPKAGINRYEDILKFVGLDGAVPEGFGEVLFNAKLIRNAWAHSAGRADARFAIDAPHLRWKQGDLIKLTLDETGQYITAVMLYGMVIANRHRAENGLPPVPAVTGKAANSDLGRAYTALYPDSNQD
ncbi:hypothetical protein ACQI4L_09140 [Mycolicibacterium litorale]|uniref:hypothetical protein n=1 Tax=Mycolicibacterium litorale TaxID=758802 RepID=UPI003CFAB1ED